MFYIMLVKAPQTDLEVEDAIVEASRRQARALHDELTFIAEFDRREAWRTDGARSMVDWLGYRLGYGERTARQRVEAARALEHLPALADGLWEGQISPDKLFWVASFATPGEDVEWLHTAADMTAKEIRSIALHRRRLTREMADARFKRRYLRIVADEEEGVVRIWGRLSDVEGAMVKKLIERFADRAPRDAETGRRRPLSERSADALVEICSHAAAKDPDPDRANIVIHVDADALASAEGVGTCEGRTPVAIETVRRLACDGRMQVVAHDELGSAIAMSRMSRTIPQSHRREMLDRDGGCVFPGCPCDGWIHGHHIEHVFDGGQTEPENLLSLCPFHHQLMHEGGWTLRIKPDGRFDFVRPDGTILGCEHRPP
jgi:hypothetical protein